MARHDLGPEESLANRAARGEYSILAPLDYFILDFLPDEGTLFAGLYPLGEKVTNLLKKFTPEQQKALTTTILSTRLRVLNIQKLVVNVHDGTSKGTLWQRTATGKAELEKWKGANTSDPSTG